MSIFSDYKRGALTDAEFEAACAQMDREEAWYEEHQYEEDEYEEEDDDD